MNNKQLIGFVGAGCLVAGVFAPLISLPIVGELNYFGNGKGDGVFVLILAVTAFGLVAAHMYKAVLVTATISAGLIGYTFFQFVSRMSKVKGDLSASDPGSLAGSFSRIASESIQMQWGWGLLIVGVVMLVTSAAMEDPENWEANGE
ncbi:MAG: hypothetical protein H6961_09360 [Chromatiaceae bacterium]|nr:hypothetical protein [Chromatiaceae bacterium]HPR07460.1 hypothetical protein [Denitromonas sp.]